MLTSDYDLLEEIGRGRFGVVSKAKFRKTNELFVVKSIDKSSLSGDATDRMSLINEPKALHLLSLSSTSSSSSCHVTRLHSTYDTPTHLHLILDYFPHPSLHDLGRLTEPEARPVIHSLLQALLHCHSNGVVHRDIKPDNILFDPNSKRVKLIDFGSCGFVDGNGLTEVVGTPYYVAPEILEGREYGEKVDVWSAGVVLYVLVAGFPPFYGERIEEVFHKVVRANLRFPFSGVSSCLKDLLRRLICKDVSRRFSVRDALKHPWFKASEEQSTQVT